MSTDLTGRKLGNYKIHRRLGKGGMGEVYLAHDEPLDRPVALKVMLARWAHDASVVERFHREARAAAKLNHPNIVQIHAVGIEEEIPYFAMEFVDGTPLDKLLKAQGPFPWQRALNIVGQVASALGAAHAKGIVHRDIKPANILIDRQGRARVTDFGVAKVLTASTQLTTDGSYIGTPQYMSPEQCGMGEMSSASDLFSLGVTAFEMLSGSIPFEGDTPATLIRKITQDQPRRLSDFATGIPDSVHSLVYTMLEKDVSRRYKNAREVMNEISRILSDGGSSPATIPSSLAAKTVVTPKRHWLSGRNLAFAGAALVLCASVVLVGIQRKRINSLERTAQQGGAQEALEMTPTAQEVPMPEIKAQFIQHDTNANGRIEDSEVPEAARPVLMHADANGDHAVDMDEFLRARQRIKERMAAPGKRPGQLPLKGKAILQPDELMFMFDLNLDGVITPPEVPPQFPNLMRLADTNRDGKISVREIQESRKPKR